MKIEKLTENKIKIMFNNKDLEEQHISIHSFMSNSIENQNLFLYILEVAEKEVGFITENYKISIETLTQNNDNFTLIISRVNESIKKCNSERLHFSRKQYNLSNKISLFKFCNSETFIDFSKTISRNFPEIYKLLEGKNSLFKLNDSYFLSIKNIPFDKNLLFKVTCILSEFSEFINISDITYFKLKECSELLIENFAISCYSKI